MCGFFWSPIGPAFRRGAIKKSPCSENCSRCCRNCKEERHYADYTCHCEKKTGYGHFGNFRCQLAVLKGSGFRFYKRTKIACWYFTSAPAEIQREKSAKRTFCLLSSTGKNVSDRPDEIRFHAAAPEASLGRMLFPVSLIHGFASISEIVWRIPPAGMWWIYRTNPAQRKRNRTIRHPFRITDGGQECVKVWLMLRGLCHHSPLPGYGVSPLFGRNLSGFVASIRSIKKNHTRRRKSKRKVSALKATYWKYWHFLNLLFVNCYLLKTYMT